MIELRKLGIYEEKIMDLELCADSLESDEDVDELITFRRGGLGLFMAGKNGVGKTVLGTSLLYSAFKKGFLVYRTSFHEAVVDYTEEWKVPAKFIQPSYLFFDEVGKELQKNVGPQLLEYVVRQRIELKKPTILATNMKPTTFFEHYGPTLESDIKAFFKAPKFKSEDRRQR